MHSANTEAAENTIITDETGSHLYWFKASASKTSHGRTFQSDIILGNNAYVNKSTSGWKC